MDRLDPLAGPGAFPRAPPMTPIVFLSEVEGLPLIAPQGRLAVGGWCLASNHPAVPAVRLQVAGQTLAPVSRRARPDVLTAHCAGLAVLECGFVFAADLPAGVHLAGLEASLDDQDWHPVRRFTVRSTPAVLHVEIEGIPADRRVYESRRLAGWIVHPQEKLEEIWLSYGNQRLRCDWGLAREDVAALLPGAPDAAHSGFITERNLPVGRGPLRIKARTRSGDSYFAATGTMVDIERDETHPAPVDWPAHRAGLGPACRSLPPAPPPADPAPPLKILFLLHADFTSSRAVQVVNLADECAALGHHCTVAVPKSVETSTYFSGRRFASASHETVLRSEEKFDVVHVWTTRECVRRCAVALREAGRVGRLLVHLEDNEQRILEIALGRPLIEIEGLPPAELEALVGGEHSHPQRGREFLAGADGVTVILDTLRSLVPPGPAVHTLWPAADERYFFPRPPPVDFRRALGWEDRRIVLFYHGDVHAANRAEVRELYAAVLALNRADWPCTLLRLGRDSGDDYLDGLRPEIDRHILNLGHVGRHQYIPLLMQLADYFVQPGWPGGFNDYRFPAKLPEFFALGRPVILPRSNLGCRLEHGTDAWVLERVDCSGIVEAVCVLHGNPELRLRLAEGAAAFARTHFSRRRSAAALCSIYRSVPAGRVPAPRGSETQVSEISALPSPENQPSAG